MAYVARASRILPVPAKVAFDRLADHDGWARWMPTSFRPVGPPLGRLAEGARFRVRILGLPAPATCTVVAVRPDAELSWSGGRRGVLHGEHRFVFHPKGETSVEIESVETWSGAIASLLRPIIQRGATKVGQEQLEALAATFAS
jgi:hypothetical protein